MSRTQLLLQLHEEIRSCRRCLDAGYDIAPGAVFSGSEQARVMVIGQAPGVTEAMVKRPFNAGSGRRLFQWLGAAGWDEEQFRSRHYMSAVTKCYPGKSTTGKGDRVPSREEQALCRPFLEREWALVNPRLVIVVGKLAIGLFYPAGASLNRLIGAASYFPPGSLIVPGDFAGGAAVRLERFDASLPREGRWLVPLPHPSGASLWPNKPENRALIERTIRLLAELRVAYDL
jgi:uracil-DNA glycosylase